MIERLENRRCCAGTVNVIVEGNKVRIAGDAAANAVHLFRPDDGSGETQAGLRISTAAKTRLNVNGREVTLGAQGANAALLPTNGARLIIDMGDGDDFVAFSSSPVFGNTTILLGGGDDKLNASDAGFKNLVVDGGDGEDRMTFYLGSRVLASGNVALFPGAGRDHVDFSGGAGTLRIGGKFWINDRQGPLGFTGSHLSVGRETVIATGNSIDRLTLTDSVFGRDAVFDTRGGDDVIDLTDSAFRGGKTVLPGTGVNTVNGA